MEYGLWTAVCIVMIFIELINPASLICIWFAIGALFALLSVLLGANLVGQAIIFFIASLLALILVRPIAKKYFENKIVPTNADRIIGRQLYLTKGIKPNSWGEVTCNGVAWSVACKENSFIPVNTLVEVISIEGSKLIVKEIKG